MIPKWTGDVVRLMHIYGITSGELAKHLGCSKTWVSKVLNGKAKPAGAREEFKGAVEELVKIKRAKA